VLAASWRNFKCGREWCKHASSLVVGRSKYSKIWLLSRSAGQCANYIYSAENTVWEIAPLTLGRLRKK
jgi:hypothetical protein